MTGFRVFSCSLTQQTNWDSVAHPPLPVFFAASCEWYLVENEFGDCGWLLTTDAAVAPDLERICNIGSSSLASELGASGRAYAAPCSWVIAFSTHSVCLGAHIFILDQFATPQATVACFGPGIYHFSLRPPTFESGINASVTTFYEGTALVRCVHASHSRSRIILFFVMPCHLTGITGYRCPLYNYALARR